MDRKNSSNQVVINILLIGKYRIDYNLLLYRMIQLTKLLFPDIKRIMIDKKDEDIFKEINEHKGKVYNYLINSSIFNYFYFLFIILNIPSLF